MSPPPDSAILAAVDRWAVERPSHGAVVEIDPAQRRPRVATWAEFASLVAARTGVLAGVANGRARVLCALPSGVDLASWIVAALGSGVQIILMHPRSGEGEFTSVFQRSGSSCVLAPEDLCARLAPSIPRIDPGVTARQGRAPRTAGRGGVVLGSSGTTGLPRLALRESPALDADGAGIVRAMSLSPDDAVLCVPPLSHSYAVDLLAASLLSGAQIRLMSEYDPGAAGASLRGGGGLAPATVLPGVPFVLESLARLDRADPAPRIVVSAGATLHPRVREAFTARWGVEVGQLYGATELGTVAINLPGRPGFDPCAIGGPLPGVGFRVLDPQDPGRILAPGMEGELAVRAPSMLSAYLDAPLDLADGHLRTGDLVVADERAWVTITGRLKLLIDSGGFKVNPQEVELALAEHPGVRECAVVALPLSDTIQRLAAFVVPADPASPPSARDLRAHLRDRLAPIKIPRVFEHVDALPRTALGKLRRDRLTPARGEVSA